MADYRVFFYDVNGHITEPPKVVTCETDGEAIAETRQLVDEHTVELWEGARLIAEIARGSRAVGMQEWLHVSE